MTEMVNRRRPKCGRHQFTAENRRNSQFEQYYKGQNIVPADEWDQFMYALGQELPINFRITGFRGHSKDLLRFIKDRYKTEISKMDFPVDANGERKPVSFEPLSWYPDNMAWQLDTDKYVVRKTPGLKALHQFLVSEMESGKISRQEAVSMLPPLLLDIKRHHTVLDLCAAPGSKSAQLVEMLHADAERSITTDDTEAVYEEPSGLLIANDLDQKRCYMMVHQIKRLQSPCALVTQEDATCFPRLYSTFSTKDKGSTNEVSQLFFDRVLADVPCSGDGTLRKNPDIWLRWNPNLGLSEHALQSRILRRGLELLRDPIGNDKKDCARLVYSTCSFNPLENEAVVASLLNACQGTVLLVDLERLDCVTAELNASGERKFRIRPGLSTWRVMTRKGVWFERFDDVPTSLHSNIRPSMFPPTNVSELHLDRCMRVMPHDQNTGGFFIAVLEKVAPLPWVKQSHMTNKVNPEAPLNQEKTEPKPTHTLNELLKKPRILIENPFTYVDPSSDEDWAKIRDYYGITEESRANRYISGRSFCASNLLYRSAGEDALRRRQFYYTNHFVKDLIVHNACRGLKIVNCGVRIFSIMEDKQFNGYRLLQDGVDLADAFLPATGGRRILLTEDQYSDLVLLLEEEMPLLSRFSEATQSVCSALSPGPVLIEYRPSGSSKLSEQHPSVQCRIVFAGWRGIRSLRHYIGRHERCHLMRMANLEPKPMICGRSPTSNQDGDGPNEPEEDDEAPGDNDFQCETQSAQSKPIND